LPAGLNAVVFVVDVVGEGAKLGAGGRRRRRRRRKKKKRRDRATIPATAIEEEG
jgi:hypothetical protein